jgi:diketogulonate reductase-like aldo/keto reductase
VLEDSLIRDLAQKHDKTPAQIVLRWQIQHGVVTIPKSSTKEHIEANFEVFDFELSQDEMDQLDGIPKHEKIYQIDLEDEIYGIPS